MLASVRLEYARSLSEGVPKPGRLAVSWGPMAQSQSPPPAVWSGKPRNVEDEPSCVTRKALQPAGTPVGAITKDRPNLSVRMLGSAALLLPLSSRFGLKVAVGGGAAPAGADAKIDMAPSNAVTAASAIEARTRFPMLPPSGGGPSRHEPRGRYPFLPLSNPRIGLSAWNGRGGGAGLGYARVTRASQAWIDQWATFVSNASSSIDSTVQPSAKDSWISACVTRRGP